MKNCTRISQVRVIINKGYQQGIFFHYWNILKSATFQNLSDFLGKSISHVKQVRLEVMPSPSASSKFGLSILKFFKHAQFFMYTQNHFGILKS